MCLLINVSCPILHSALEVSPYPSRPGAPLMNFLPSSVLSGPASSAVPWDPPWFAAGPWSPYIAIMQGFGFPWHLEVFEDNVCFYALSESESHSVVSDSLRPRGLYSPWNSPGQNTGVDSLSLLQGVFPIQGLNSGLPLCRWILYQLSHQGSPRILEWAGYPFSRGSSWPRNKYVLKNGMDDHNIDPTFSARLQWNMLTFLIWFFTSQHCWTMCCSY